MLFHPRYCLAALVFAFLFGCGSVPPDDVTNACAIFDDKGGWYKATHRAEKRWGLPKHIQLAIIGQESGFDADAKPKRRRFLGVIPGERLSSSRGYPQAVRGTWEQYQRASGNINANRRSFSDAADFVAWYGAQSNARVGVALGDAYNQYLAYHEGWGGYAERSYRSKNSVIAAAQSVSQTADRYRAQLARCENRFRRGIPLVPFI
ncbi:MAG: transglycosylase SLT domain-containing protein [Hyphococcus sp.]